ncbi:GAF domain-containing sensor histidine kinase [Sphingomonas astaxanthinifaciens]|nr:GAF domain-containing sensor histidine kinase [Sphingomonas astaxanthinifaciens]
MIESQDDLRERVIARYRLGEGEELAFNQLSRTVAEVFGFPIALLTVLRRDRQMFQGVCGVSGTGTSRESAFCSHTVRKAEVMVVEDALLDPRFRDNDHVTGHPFIRFYAGAPVTIAGVAVGALCVIDHQPRNFSAEQRELLSHLADVAASLIETRLDSFVSERRERELKRQTDLLRVMLDNVDQGIAYFDDALKLTLWNERFFELHGFPDEMKRRGADAAEMLRISINWGLFGPEATEAWVPEMLEAIRNTPSSERTIATREGRLLHSVRIRLDDRQGFIVAVRDLTAERSASRAKDEFISTVSHELRTPLTAIRGALALLNSSIEGKVGDGEKLMLQMAEKNSLRLNRLIDDILDIERLSRGQTGYFMVPILMEDVVRDAVQQNQPFAHSLGVKLVGHARQTLPVSGDPGRLLQVLTNLIANAVRHSPEGAEVDVVAVMTERGVRVEVCDRGSGVPADFVDRLFERFSQAIDPNRRGHGGTGLGLAISRAIIEQHGGRIGYSPRDGGGSSFWIELPAA